jgi:hypothetical protein
VEFLVAALIVAVLLVVAGRFLFRSPSGEVVLPSVIDESVGMWALRRVTGLRLWERPDPNEDARAAAEAVAWPDADARARYEASRGIAAASASGAALGTRGASRNRWPNRLAALLAVVSIAMIAITVVGLTVLPRGDPGSSGGPDQGGASAGPGGSSLAVATASGSPGAVASGSPVATAPAASARASAAGPTPSAVAGRTTAPSIGPVVTPAPTPSAVRPTPAPTAKPSAASTPTPTPTPAVTPPPGPLKASLSCSAVALLATCDASGSTGATTYEIDWGDGTPADSGPSPFLLHTYLATGTFKVTLTVSDGTGHTAKDSTNLTIGS